MTRSGWAALVVLCGLAVPLGARAEEPARTRVAVLEYRGGVVQAAGIGQRLADRLKKTSGLKVVDPQEARRRLGPRLDSEVAACAGEARCVAGMGARLDVDEVLLVGVSQLGDVVLALQRIDVGRREVGPRDAETLSAGQEVDDALASTWLQKLYPPEVFKRFGYIAIVANVDGAAVSINGQSRGETPVAKVKVLAPHAYRVNLSKEGYTPFTARIEVPPDATVEVRAELTPQSVPLAWYKRWYLWAIVGGLAAGAAIGVSIYVTRPDDMHVSGFINPH